MPTLAGMVLLGTSTPAYALDLSAFANVTITVAAPPDPATSDPTAAAGYATMAIGMLDFYAAQELSSRTDGLIELVFEAMDGELGVDLERLQIGYSLGQAATVRVGRFHNVLGAWNSTFHHGAHIQLPIERPFLLRFEDDGGFYPAHVLGTWADLDLALPGTALSIDAMIGTGSELSLSSGGAVELGFGDSPDQAPGASLSVVFRPDALPGLAIGASGWFGVVTDLTPSVADPWVEGIEAAQLVWQHDRWDLWAEGYRFEAHAQEPSKASYGGYLQLGYSIRALTPYVRASTFSAQPDAWFSALGVTDGAPTPSTEGLVGARLDLGTRTALKAEVRATGAASGFQPSGAVQCTAAF